MNHNEKRVLYDGGINVRNSKESDTVLSGLALPFDKWTRINAKEGGYFYECIQRGALKETLEDGHNIYCLVEHKYHETLGDTRSNLTLYDREDGLHFELKATNNRAHQMAAGIQVGFFNKCSFEFTKTDWDDEKRDGVIWRTIKKMKLHEISLLNNPAYTQTNAEIQGNGETDYRVFGSSRRTMADIPGIQFR